MCLILRCLPHVSWWFAVCYRALWWVLTAGAHPSTCHWVGVLKGSSFVRHSGWNCSVDWGCHFDKTLLGERWIYANQQLVISRQRIDISWDILRLTLGMLTQPSGRLGTLQKELALPRLKIGWAKISDMIAVWWTKLRNYTESTLYSLLHFYSATRLGVQLLPITYSR